MKNSIYITISFIFTLLACEEHFLEKPLGGDTNLDSIFTTSDKAISALSKAYSMNLAWGYPEKDWAPGNSGMNGFTLDELSGDNMSVFSWESGYNVTHSGMEAVTDWNNNGSASCEDAYSFRWKGIRQAYLVIENIDRVTDMEPEIKQQIKKEMKALIAFSYTQMFKRYGGVPLVHSTINIGDNNKIPRATLQETLDFILNLCDEAKTLPNIYPDNLKGRLTKGAVLAIKAEALLFAARPLFNSDTPYLDLGENNKLICFCKENPDRWTEAAEAAKAVIDWAKNESGWCHLIDTDNPLDDYGTATSTPNNAEMILSYNVVSTSMSKCFDPHFWWVVSKGMTFRQLTQYHRSDGSDQTWAGTSARPFKEYVSKMNEMEPRFKASCHAYTIDAWNNPGDSYWSAATLYYSQTNNSCAVNTKFWYKAGRRNWFYPPIYRLARIYLDLAEAYNESGHPNLALLYLNDIRDRAGLPLISETEKIPLRKLINRERRIELYKENCSYFDYRHCKLAGTPDSPYGNMVSTFKYTYNSSNSGKVESDYKDYKVEPKYILYWSDNQFLYPFPQSEINKKYLIQNPGY